MTTEISVMYGSEKVKSVSVSVQIRTVLPCMSMSDIGIIWLYFSHLSYVFAVLLKYSDNKYLDYKLLGYHTSIIIIIYFDN